MNQIQSEIILWVQKQFPKLIDTEQVYQFISCILNINEVVVCPSLDEKQIVQVYQIQKNRVFRPKSKRKKSTRKNQEEEPLGQNVQKKQRLFYVNVKFLLNCLLICMTKVQQISFKLAILNENFVRKKQTSNLEKLNLKIYQFVYSYFTKNYESNQQINSSPFYNLKQCNFSFQVQFMSDLEILIGLQFFNRLVNFFSQGIFHSIKKLSFKIKGTHPESILLNNQAIKQIQNNFYEIVKNTKKIKVSDSSQGYFPNLKEIQFFIVSQKNQIEENKLEEDLNKCEIIKLQVSIIGLENSQKFLNHMNYLLKHFPVLKHLSISSQIEKQINLQSLVSIMSQNTQILQSFQISGNVILLEKIQGLKEILGSLPYLSNLYFPPVPTQQVNVNEWQILKKIQFRRIYVQKLFNMIKILQKFDHKKDFSLQVIKFIQPLKM